MNYIKCFWKHNHLDEPIIILSEIDTKRTELRKIEIFKDGFVSFADHQTNSKKSILYEIDFPPIDEINANPEFMAILVSKSEFEKYWRLRNTYIDILQISK